MFNVVFDPIDVSVSPEPDESKRVVIAQPTDENWRQGYYDFVDAVNNGQVLNGRLFVIEE